MPQFFKTTRDQLSHDAGTGAPVVYNETEGVFFLKRAAQLGYGAAVDTSVFAFHWDQKANVAFPLDLWAEFQKTGTVTIGDEVAA